MCAGGLKGSIFGVWLLAGLIYISLPCIMLIWLRNDPSDGRSFIIWFFCVIWTTDIGAYLFGRSIGGPKLAPKISPNKTWAGFLGGVGAAVVVSWGLMVWQNISISLTEVIILSAILAVAGQLGDLLESWVKRYFNIKDSGAIIPGHGGILDRVDAILLAAPVATVIGIIYGIGDFPWK